MDGEVSYLFLYVGSFLGSCMWMALLGYNAMGLFSFMREDTEGEVASPLAKAAWAISFASFLLGPCAWFGASCALILVRMERGRMYSEKSSLAGATPCRIAGINAGITLMMWAAITVGLVATAVQ
jgi:hypothetical protein